MHWYTGVNTVTPYALEKAAREAKEASVNLSDIGRAKALLLAIAALLQHEADKEATREEGR